MKTALLVGITCLILSVQPCSAEWFADVYSGVSLTDKHDFKAVSTEAGHATYKDVEFEKGLAYGLRFGRYFDAVPFLGLGVDYFSFMPRSEEHTSELESPYDLVCRILLEKKKK